MDIEEQLGKLREQFPGVADLVDRYPEMAFPIVIYPNAILFGSGHIQVTQKAVEEAISAVCQVIFDHNYPGRNNGIK